MARSFPSVCFTYDISELIQTEFLFGDSTESFHVEFNFDSYCVFMEYRLMYTLQELKFSLPLCRI